MVLPPHHRRGPRLGPSQPLSRKPTQESRDPEAVVAHRVRRRAGLNQRQQPVTCSRMNHPAPPVEHDGEVHSGSGPHPTKPERSRGNHGSTLRAATDSEADVSTTKKNQPVTDNRGRCSMATDKQRQLRRMPRAPERRHGGAGVRCCRTGRTPRRLAPLGGRPVAGAVTAGGPPSCPACAAGRLRRTAIRTRTAGDRGRAAAEAGNADRRLGVLMEGSRGSPGKGRPLARPAVGPVPAPQSSAAPGPVLSTTFWLLSCRIVRVRSGPSSPSFVGACGSGNVPAALLRR
jgi:hypothetical protein